jgi:hypothetical protein
MNFSFAPSFWFMLMGHCWEKERSYNIAMYIKLLIERVIRQGIAKKNE